MSQFNSIQNENLSRKVANLERDLIELKTKQIYGMNDLRTFISNTVTESSHTYTQRTPDGSFTFTASGTNILKLRFVGNKPRKTVVGLLKYSWNIHQQGTSYDIRYIKSYRGSSPNVLEFLVFADGGNDAWGATYTTFDINFSVISNDVGTLQRVDSYDIGTYYQWVMG